MLKLVALAKLVGSGFPSEIEGKRRLNPASHSLPAILSFNQLTGITFLLAMAYSNASFLELSLSGGMLPFAGSRAVTVLQQV